MLTNPPELPHRPGATDADLRACLRASLAEPPQPDVRALEDRVLSQWQLRAAAGGPVPHGHGGVLALGWRSRPVLAGLVVLALVAALGLQHMQKSNTAAMDELAEPDVLSLIALGEL